MIEIRETKAKSDLELATFEEMEIGSLYNYNGITDVYFYLKFSDISVVCLKKNPEGIVVFQWVSSVQSLDKHRMLRKSNKEIELVIHN